MSDPKIRRSPGQGVTPPASSPPAPKSSSPSGVGQSPRASPAGHEKKSSFDPQVARSRAEYSAGVGDESEGRKALGGVADDSVGRKALGGVADDSVGRKALGGVADDSVGRKALGGVADDSVGRKALGGVADDSVGRKALGGVADDSVGRGVADDSVGVADDSVGRGVADDSVGRKNYGGVADDSVGVEVGPDEDPDHAALREAIFQRLETPRYLDVDELPPSRPPELGAAGKELTGLLSQSHSASLMAAAQKDPVVGARLDNLLKATVGLPAETRAALIDTLASEGPRTDGARVLEEITRSTAWKRLTNSQKVQLADVMTATSEKGLVHLGALLETAPGKLLEQDTRGGTLLSNLHVIATQPLNAALYRHTSSPELLEALLRDAVNPNRIDQGDTTTCTVTSMQWELVNDDRAEYARLVAGLTGPEGKVALMGGGVLRANAEDGLDAARHGRSISSALFQSAAIEYANGWDAFDPITGKSTKYDGSREYGGLNPDQQKRMLTQLFGLKYSTDNLQSEAEGATALETLRGYDAARETNRPILMDIDQGTVNHSVTLERIREGRVYFRDPYGELRSMPEASFAKVVVGLHRPAAAA